MRGFVIAALLSFVLAPVADAQEQQCTQCGFRVDEDQKASWGTKAFCGEGCRDEFNTDRRRCSICNDRVAPTYATVRTDGYFVYHDAPKAWDGFCDFCREEVASGTKDPVEDRYRPDGVQPIAASGFAGLRQRVIERRECDSYTAIARRTMVPKSR